jgi:hypothetical protein
MRKRIDKVTPGQLSLFDLIKRVSQEENKLIKKSGSFNIDAQIRALLSEALKRCPLSREVVAAKMSELLGREISKSRLDSWTAESKENHRIPFDSAMAFCEVTGSMEIFQVATEILGCYLIKGKDALLTELGRIKQQKDEINKNERLIKMKLERMGD